MSEQPNNVSDGITAQLSNISTNGGDHNNSRHDAYCQLPQL
jgi:hypothetical protein